MNTLIRRLERTFSVIAALCMIAVMLIVSYDAFARYALNAPLMWSFEIISYYLLIALTYLAVSSTFRRGDHIGVDLFYNMMSKRLRCSANLTSAALALILFSLITYGAWEEMLKQIGRNSIVPGYLALPAWASYLPVFLGALLFCLRLVLHIVALVRLGEDPEVIDHSEEVME